MDYLTHVGLGSPFKYGLCYHLTDDPYLLAHVFIYRIN